MVKVWVAWLKNCQNSKFDSLVQMLARVNLTMQQIGAARRAAGAVCRRYGQKQNKLGSHSLGFLACAADTRPLSLSFNASRSNAASSGDVFCLAAQAVLHQKKPLSSNCLRSLSQACGQIGTCYITQRERVWCTVHHRQGPWYALALVPRSVPAHPHLLSVSIQPLLCSNFSVAQSSFATVL